MYLERGKAKIKIESCVGKKTSSFLENFKTAVNGEGREEQHRRNWLNAEDFHTVWFWKWNWFLLKFQIIQSRKMCFGSSYQIFCHSALLLTFSFCYYSTICSYAWRYKVLPRMYTACVTPCSLKCSRRKCTSVAEILSAGQVHAGVLTGALGMLYNPGKGGLVRKASQKSRGT